METTRKLPKKERPVGLFLFCNKCHKQYINDSVIKCRCNQLVYRARVHVSGTKKGERKLILEAKNFEDAFVEFKKFKNTLIKNSFQKFEIKQTEYKPVLLIECFAYYMGYLNNVNVAVHKMKIRTPAYIKKFEYDFNTFKDALQLYGINANILKFSDINDIMVGYVHEYLLDVKKYANKTYNGTMSNYSGFTTHIINKFKYDYTNPFLGVENRHTTSENVSLNETEFHNLLEIITPENGLRIKVKKGRKDSYVNLYRDWLKHGILIGLFTGGRSEEIVELKWSQIQLKDDKSFDRFKIIHYKIERANSHLVSKNDRITKDVVITKELGDFLIELGYESLKESDDYIIAPKSLNRRSVGRDLSTGFNFYYKKLNTGKEVTFKNLRKTYITSAVNQFGLGAMAISGHGNFETIKNHYYDKEVVKKEAQSTFSVFKKKKEQK